MKRKLINKIVEFSNVEVVFSKEQYFAYNTGEISLLDVKLNREANEKIKGLTKTEYAAVVLLLAVFMFKLNQYNNTLIVTCLADPLTAIDTLGNGILRVVEKIAKWAVIIIAMIDIVKSVMKGSTNANEIWSIIFKNALIYASIFLLPFILDLVQGAFA